MFQQYASNILSWMPPLLKGAGLTVSLTVLSVSAGLFLGFFLALGKISQKNVISKLCGAYIFFFRGTPLLMQLFFIYYALPSIIPAFTINSRFAAAFIAFSLNCAAYCAEIIRAAIQSVSKDQTEACRVLGFTNMQALRLVILPQALKRMIPPIGNEFIMMLKDVSLVYIIALVDITRAMRSIESSTGSALVYLPAMALYLVITAIFTAVFKRLEKKYSIN